MNAQRIRTSEGRLVAHRFVYPAEIATDISPGKVAFIPEFQAVAYNVKIERGMKVATYPLPEPERQGDLTARHMVRVWFGDRLAEEWFFAKPTEDKKPIANFVGERILAERKAHSANAPLPPAPFYKHATDTTVDPYKQAVEVTLRMLREEYPNTAKHPTPESFTIDMVRLTGRADTQANLSDPHFIIELSKAALTHAQRVKRKQLYDAAEWFIASPQRWPELCALPPEEISRRVESATKIKLSPGTIQQRIFRLGLTTAHKRGRKS